MIKDNAGNKIMLDGEMTSVKDGLKLTDGGVSIYEVLRVMDSTPLFLKEHIKRLENSFIILNHSLPEKIKRVEDNLKKFIKESKMENGNIKIICDGMEDGKYRIIIYEVVSRYPEKELYTSGVAVSKINKRRIMPGAKIMEESLRLDADKMKREKGVYEVLLVDNQGNITEGSRSNIFFVKDGVLHTPPLEQVLPGITRLKVIEFCKKKDIEVKIHKIREENLFDFDGAFLTGTSINMLPVKMIDGLVYNVDGFVAELSRLFEIFIREEAFNA